MLRALSSLCKQPSHAKASKRTAMSANAIRRIQMDHPGLLQVAQLTASSVVSATNRLLPERHTSKWPAEVLKLAGFTSATYDSADPRYHAFRATLQQIQTDYLSKNKQPELTLPFLQSIRTQLSSGHRDFVLW